MRALLHIILPLAILGLGVWGYFGTQKLKETGYKLNQSVTSKPKRSGAPSGPRKQRKIHTKAQALEKTDFIIHLRSQGVIRAHNATTLTAQVSGRVIEVAHTFEDGDFFEKGDVLLKLDTADYLTALETAKAKLAKSIATHAQEEARSKQALLNWNDAGFKGEASELVLRKPQLRDAEAGVTASQSGVAQAERNLARTQVRAPYDGRVRKRNIGLGQQIGATTALGEIFATDFAEVRLPLTAKDLRFYTPPNKPNAEKTPNNVIFTSILTSAKPLTTFKPWVGSILRAEGELDTASRQLFVIARIDDPFGLSSDKPSLFIGQPVRAIIPAHTLKDVYIIPRNTLSDVNEILVIREGKIHRLSIDPVFSESDHIIIRDGILPGDQLCTSRLPYAPEGAPVEIIPEEDDTDTASQDSTNKHKKHRKGAGHGAHK